MFVYYDRLLDRYARQVASFAVLGTSAAGLATGALRDGVVGL